jgi:elongator complex protein 3
MSKREDWHKKRQYTAEMLETARKALDEVIQGSDVLDAIRHNPLPSGGHIAKHAIVAVYRRMIESGEMRPDPALLASIRMKPVRSLSGVTTVTILTRPHPCPGECIFCPDDQRMPKSYLPDEPAAARAYENNFDPYKQVVMRLRSLSAVGHPTDKIELLILGGSWTAYPRDYQEWFVLRCFEAMNEQESSNLEDAQRINESAPHRNVGLVIETRPDEITPDELAWLRRLGVTKVQMGAQSLDDRILKLNRRGHTTVEMLRAVALLRAAAFKIVLHWMPNLLGVTLDSDRLDYTRLWATGSALPELSPFGGPCPDEIKVYPTQLLQNAPLYTYWQRGEYQPYTTAELVDLLAEIKPSTPAYCRINRMIRDIPSLHVVEGNKRTSLRQDVQAEVVRRGQNCNCIRCREIRGETVTADNLQTDDLVYQPAFSEEHFLSYVTSDNRLAGYLRLSLPQQGSHWQEEALGISQDQWNQTFPDLRDAALIREVHVYGQALQVGREQVGAAQHSGLGTSLLEQAEELARTRGYSHLAVIAAVGTRQYYAARGFKSGELYMVKKIAVG